MHTVNVASHAPGRTTAKELKRALETLSAEELEYEVRVFHVYGDDVDMRSAEELRLMPKSKIVEIRSH